MIERLQWVAIVAAAFGLVLIVQPWGFYGNHLSNVLSVGAGIVWALGAIMVKRLQEREPMDLLSMTAWQMTLGCIPLIALSFLVPEEAIIWSTRFVGNLIFIAIGVTGLGSMLWMYALSNLKAGIAGLATLAAPPIAMISSALYFQEHPNVAEWFGMFFILMALMTLSFGSQKLPDKTN